MFAVLPGGVLSGELGLTRGGFWGKGKLCTRFPAMYFCRAGDKVTVRSVTRDSAAVVLVLWHFVDRQFVLGRAKRPTLAKFLRPWVRDDVGWGLLAHIRQPHNSTAAKVGDPNV